MRGGAGSRAACGRRRLRWCGAGPDAATDRAREGAAFWMCRGRPDATGCRAREDPARGFPAHGPSRAGWDAVPRIGPHHCLQAAANVAPHLQRTGRGAARRGASLRRGWAARGSRWYLASWGAARRPARHRCRRAARGSRWYLASSGAARRPAPHRCRRAGRAGDDAPRLPPHHGSRASRDDAAPRSQGGHQVSPAGRAMAMTMSPRGSQRPEQPDRGCARRAPRRP